MKKIVGWVLFISMIFVPLTSQAQLSFGVKGGLNISTVKLNEKIISSDNVTGFHIGPMMELIAPFLGLGFDAAILYSQKGIDSDWGSLSTDYIEVPVNLKWKFGLPIFKLFVAGGPYVGFRVGGDKFWEVPGNIVKQIETKSFAAGVNLGLGVELIKHLQVGFNYGFGLTENYSIYEGDKSAEAKNRTISLSAAIIF